MSFWDSSALVPLLVETDRTQAVKPLVIHGPELLVWWGAEIECASALTRMAREGTEPATIQTGFRNLEALLRKCRIVAPNEDVKHAALRVLRLHPLRAADAMQLAAAIVACEGRPSALEFVTLDRRLETAAQKEGFRVIRPGG